jgi:hypothetical protein
MRTWPLLLVIAALGCGTEADAPRPAASVQTGTAHGDHSPHHGGVVMMKGDLHYEVVLDPTGRYRLYFTDAMRQDLPASTAMRASLTIARKGAPPEGVALQIDEAGESWTGQGRSVADPATTTARLAYTLRGEEPYWIDLPFVSAADPTPHR